MAEEADPTGARTMGVLTKPDLATETTTQQAVVDLILGQNHPLKLGYYAVKNRSADDEHSTRTKRLQAEMLFFTHTSWSSVFSRCGTPALKTRIRELLTEISKREMPLVRSDIEGRLRQCQAGLNLMGLSRSDTRSRRAYLGKLVWRFQVLTQSALNAYYLREPLFKAMPKLKLITRLIRLNESFSDQFWKGGHLRHFKSVWDEEGESCFGNTEDTISTDATLESYRDCYPELLDIIQSDSYKCSKPLKGPLIERIKMVFEDSRGPEIGTVCISPLFDNICLIVHGTNSIISSLEELFLLPSSRNKLKSGSLWFYHISVKLLVLCMNISPASLESSVKTITSEPSSGTPLWTESARHTVGL